MALSELDMMNLWAKQLTGYKSQWDRLFDFGYAIDAEVRKQDDELIRQMDAALDASEAFLLSAGFESSDAFQEVSAALTAGRARLEGKA